MTGPATRQTAMTTPCSKRVAGLRLIGLGLIGSLLAVLGAMALIDAVPAILPPSFPPLAFKVFLVVVVIPATVIWVWTNRTPDNRGITPRIK